MSSGYDMQASGFSLQWAVRLPHAGSHTAHPPPIAEMRGHTSETMRHFYIWRTLKQFQPRNKSNFLDTALERSGQIMSRRPTFIWLRICPAGCSSQLRKESSTTLYQVVHPGMQVAAICIEPNLYTDTFSCTAHRSGRSSTPMNQSCIHACTRSYK